MPRQPPLEDTQSDSGNLSDGKMDPKKIVPTQYTRNSLCNPVVACAYVGLRRKVAHFRRRARKNAAV